MRKHKPPLVSVEEQVFNEPIVDFDNQSVASEFNSIYRILYLSGEEQTLFDDMVGDSGHQ